MGNTMILAPVRSNVDHWKQMQEKEYFETHPCYNGLRDFSGEVDISFINWFTKPTPTMRVVVIGCGYGRETAHLAPQVGHVYGIDVSPLILGKAIRYLGEKGVSNFTPVLAERYKAEVPEGVDLVFSIVVMQHLTRALVFDYFKSLGEKLSPNGIFVVQFLEDLEPSAANQDAELRVYEPSVTWTIAQLYNLSVQSGLKFKEVRTIQVTPTALWHWVCFSKT
jgi:cyclopropane fatty-acyl-phospholipid synthase-like methyltransferase